MSTTPPPEAAARTGVQDETLSQAPPRLQQVTPQPRARRVPDGAWVAGVARGIADHLDWPTGVVRAGFVMLSFVNFLGVVVYGVLWILMPTAGTGRSAPGIDAATRTNMRTDSPRGIDTRRDAGAITALALLGVGVVWLTQAMGLGLPVNWFWPLAFATGGLALIWRQADALPPAEQRSRSWITPFVSSHGWTGITRMVVGVGMIATSVSAVVASSVGLEQLPSLLMLVVVIIGGIGLIGAPWIYRWRNEMNEVREQKILSDARADMAAHLHDSVLQTLALIQRQSDDPKAVASLARRQERELRTWLYGDAGVSGEPPKESHLAAALRTAAQEIEDERGTPVEVVCVGDAEIDADLGALVSAAREAMMNSAKHSGADRIDVFAEVEDGHVEVYVRDRGRGFAMDEIAEDRQGVRNSILARMERHGGRATIRSTPGEGTDIKLEMDL